jgi:hypothetical protein
VVATPSRDNVRPTFEHVFGYTNGPPRL